MTLTTESDRGSRRRALRDILLYGLCGGLLIAVLKLTEYRFLVVEHSVEIYVALVAALFGGPGIWLGLTLTRKKTTTIIKEIPARAAGPFFADETRVSRLKAPHPGRADRQDRPADPVTPTRRSM